MAKIIHVVFELTMPHAASWNGRWSGEDRGHYLFWDVPEPTFEKKYRDRLQAGSWTYCWPDGWCAMVTARFVDGQELRRLLKRNAGFCGYNWMVMDICNYGEIRRR